MHSQIFELKDRKDEPDELTEDSVFDQLSHYHIDYVQDISRNDYEEQLKWLRNCCNGINVDIEKRTVLFSDTKAMMQGSFDQFKSILHELDEMSIDDFASDMSRDDYSKSMSFAMYRLENAYADETGFYIYYNGSMLPLNTFIRNHTEDIAGRTYYVGHILDYHV